MRFARRSSRPGKRFLERASGEIFQGVSDPCAFCPAGAAGRVRQRVAKSRQLGRPTIDFLFIAFHSSAQACMRSRGARGSSGGGTDVSSGGNGGGARGWAGAAGGGALAGGGAVVGAGARGLTAGDAGVSVDGCAGFRASGLPRGVFEVTGALPVSGVLAVSGFLAASGFGAVVFGFDGATRGAGGAEGCCARAGATAKAQTPATRWATTILAGDERSRAAIISLFPSRAEQARPMFIARSRAGVERLPPSC